MNICDTLPQEEPRPQRPPMSWRPPSALLCCCLFEKEPPCAPVLCSRDRSALLCPGARPLHCAVAASLRRSLPAHQFWPGVHLWRAEIVSGRISPVSIVKLEELMHLQRTTTHLWYVLSHVKVGHRDQILSTPFILMMTSLKIELSTKEQPHLNGIFKKWSTMQ